jgi:hypothetical protein
VSRKPNKLFRVIGLLAQFATAQETWVLVYSPHCLVSERLRPRLAEDAAIFSVWFMGPLDLLSVITTQTRRKLLNLRTDLG